MAFVFQLDCLYWRWKQIESGGGVGLDLSEILKSQKKGGSKAPKPPPPRFQRLWSLLIKLIKLSVATCISHLPIVRGPESTRVLVTQGPWYVRVQKMLTEFDYFLNSGCWFICVVCIIYQHECVYTYILSGPIQSLDLAS